MMYFVLIILSLLLFERIVHLVVEFFRYQRLIERIVLVILYGLTIVGLGLSIRIILKLEGLI